MVPERLERFIKAQEPVYATALAEICAGRKQSHWMWFIFPQLRGLGQSPMAWRYGIKSIDEAQDYMNDPVLGGRLRECVAALQALPEADAEKVFGQVDAMKLRSSLTLFDAAGEDPLFAAALSRWFGGHLDGMTLELLSTFTQR